MNKSTPLSQLPTAIQNQNAFVNDQQKQIITNAQQAINNINMPQNTQIPTDLVNDDDTTIQEVLNHINSGHASQSNQAGHAGQAGQTGHAGQVLSPPHQMSMSPSPPLPLELQNQMYMQSQIDQSMLQNILNQHQLMNPPPPSISTPTYHHDTIGMFLHIFGDDMKLAVLVLSAFIVVHFLPLGNIIGKYIALDKIPYHDILLKALLATVVVILFKKMILKL